LGIPFGIAVERSGMILVANAQSLVRVNPETGAQTALSTGNLFRVPLAVAVSEIGDIYVVDALGPVVRVDAATGAQTLISTGGFLHRPQGIAVKGKHVYVTDVADMNFGVGRIIRIDIRSGQQTILSEGGNLVGPVGITVEPKGSLIVGDPYTANPESADVFDGGIIRIDENSGAQTLIARGNDIFVNPRGVAVIQKAGN
jgi:DNA-binding beta-propeller fold protein YncE